VIRAPRPTVIVEGPLGAPLRGVAGGGGVCRREMW
jgi:hypothetical protein